ncbi:hypothetical protein LAZ67_2003795 [Cordylochernes scorpioides]|uniref:Mos1 transposase HTH domain-containing protein n=1 Tax=Cordylochernes scorpioides TaxID=51811 RepID=A0ABY6K654_9ARAC|nr:hypothetical protein LAZ67_2003795 [Cordylochernes scorpioides]
MATMEVLSQSQLSMTNQQPITFKHEQLIANHQRARGRISTNEKSRELMTMISDKKLKRRSFKLIHSFYMLSYLQYTRKKYLATRWYHYRGGTCARAKVILIYLKVTPKCGGFTMEQKLKQRICIEFCVKLQISATEIFEMLNKAFPNDAPKRTTVFEWDSRFKAGRISIEDDPLQGRPKFKGLIKMCKKSPI